MNGCRAVALVAPHFPPSNLAGVHRARLLAQHLHEFGWRPVIVTTHWRHYEEALDWGLASLVDPALDIIRTPAAPVRPVRLVGDIGIRALPWHLAALRRLWRERRVDFLFRCIDLAADLGASVCSTWAGAAPDGSVADKRGAFPVPEILWDRLCTGLAHVLERASAQGVQLAFEPEPGMFIERPAGYEELVRRLGASGDTLGLCLDVGHCVCTGDLPIDAVIRTFASRLVLVQLDDAKRGEHVHRMFGEGELDLAGALKALLECGFDGVAAVELARDAHRGPEAAREALVRLHAALGVSRE